MITLTAALKIPNVVKWQVVGFLPHLDDTPAWASLRIQFYTGGAMNYRVVELEIFDSLPSLYLFANPTPLGILDLVSVGSKTIANALTTLVAATGTGTRNTQLKVIETSCLSLGIVDATLTGT